MLYDRFISWSGIRVFDRIFAELTAGTIATDIVMIDATRLQGSPDGDPVAAGAADR